jgi:hypothetical protein
MAKAGPRFCWAGWLLWLAFSTGHQLSSNEQGIVTTFGKYTSTIGPGMNFTAPWPIQRVRVEDVTSIRRDNVPEGEAEKLMLTGDQSLVDLSYIIRWNIRNLKQFTYQLEDPQGTVREVAEAAMRASVAEVKLNDVMLGTRRAEIETNVRNGCRPCWTPIIRAFWFRASTSKRPTRPPRSMTHFSAYRPPSRTPTATCPTPAPMPNR